MLHTLADVSSTRSLPKTLRCSFPFSHKRDSSYGCWLWQSSTRGIHSACHLLWHGTETELRTGLPWSIWSVIFTRILVVENNSIVETEITQRITCLFMRFLFMNMCFLSQIKDTHSFLNIPILFSRYTGQWYQHFIAVHSWCSVILCNFN